MSRPERQTDQSPNRSTAYLGTEGTRPYAGAGWYYAEYRERVSAELMAILARRLDWSPGDRVLDLGAGPGQLSLVIAPFVAEVVAIEPEPDMLKEGERRARTAEIRNVTFVAGSSDDLPALQSSLGLFRAAIIDEAGGAIAIVTPRSVSIPDKLRAAQVVVREILERHLVNVPPGPHPSGRHESFEDILRRSPFPRIERVERTYETRVCPTIEALIGYEYTISHVLTRLGDNRGAFEREVRAALSWIEEVGEVSVTRRDEA